MQEVAPDEFDLLNVTNSVYEKGMCLAVCRISPNISPIPPLHIPNQPDVLTTENDGNSLIDTEATTNLLNVIKNENGSTTDLFPTHPTTWHQHPINSQDHAHYRLQNHHQSNQNRMNLINSKLLLRNSDDPLICRGANNVGTADDDHTLIISISKSAENDLDSNNNHLFETQAHNTNPSTALTTRNFSKPPSSSSCSQVLKRIPQKGCSSLTKQQLKVKAGLMSAQNSASNEHKKSGQVQQTVPTYDPNNNNKETKMCKNKGIIKLHFHQQSLPPHCHGQCSHRIKHSNSNQAEMHDKTAKLPSSKTSHENVRSWLKKIAAIQRSVRETKNSQNNNRTLIEEEKMNESTIKKANDINNNYEASRTLESQFSLSFHTCNSEYSTAMKSFVRKCTSNSEAAQQPPHINSSHSDILAHNMDNSTPMKRIINYDDLPYMGEITLDNSKPRRGRKPKKADICHLIYKNYGTILPGTPKHALTTRTRTMPEIKQGTEYLQKFDDLPLNLCMRDQQCDNLSISSEELDENSISKELIEPLNSPISNVEAPLEFKFSPPLSISNNKKISIANKFEPSAECENVLGSAPMLLNGKLSKQIELNGNDILMHPINVYYQKLLSDTLENQQNQQLYGLPFKTIEKDNQLTLKIPIPNDLFRTPKTEIISPNLTAETRIVDNNNHLSPSSSNQSEASNKTSTTSSCNKDITNSTIISHYQQIPAPQKRKRSAIFIPPIPAENTTTPATEVSICKFKFTGGVKPSLQEKKMLSVDSGGNYRYYSGTGDKSTRGYEFFPRESVQNSAGFLPGINCAPNYINLSHECSTPTDIPPPSAELSNEILQIPESPTGTLLLPETSSPSPISGAMSSYSSSPSLQTQKHIKNLQTTLSSEIKNETSARTITVNSVNMISKTTRQALNLTHKKKKSRRSTQREKLERTFKEKGFLIQTQKLESAEGATYCKFRQLKKFTRYLFRNWKDYLPQEVQTHNERSIKNYHINTKNNAAEVDKEENVNKQLAIENILERHALLTTAREYNQNINKTSEKSRVIENALAEKNIVDTVVMA